MPSARRGLANATQWHEMGHQGHHQGSAASGKYRQPMLPSGTGMQPTLPRGMLQVRRTQATRRLPQNCYQ